MSEYESTETFTADQTARLKATLGDDLMSAIAHRFTDSAAFAEYCTSAGSAAAQCGTVSVTDRQPDCEPWDRGDALGRPLAELINDFDAIAEQPIPYSRLPRRWNALSDEYRHWSELAKVTPQALLYQPKIGASALRALAAAADDAVRAQRRSRTATPQSPADSATTLLNRLTDFDRELLAGLVWPPRPRRQTELAEQLNVSPVSLYRNRPRAEQRCADLLADPAHQDVRAHADTLAARLGSYVPGMPPTVNSSVSDYRHSRMLRRCCSTWPGRTASGVTGSTTPPPRATTPRPRPRPHCSAATPAQHRRNCTPH
ncbi:hypothetical protein [Mycolicibacterium tokaiense]|uniref:Uncharacterized protein n=1 Tax=Mycolicibacterium tokaiense TaxID=39695 RepID=A0A379PM54_9MYCO|nr:hypothetical protein [Mycolicibacterium tokaiense]SUE94915.1 Uncharacterised protein [Mycolicibacterium tokaiense]